MLQQLPSFKGLVLNLLPWCFTKEHLQTTAMKFNLLWHHKGHWQPPPHPPPLVTLGITSQLPCFLSPSKTKSTWLQGRCFTRKLQKAKDASFDGVYAQPPQVFSHNAAAVRKRRWSYSGVSAWLSSLYWNYSEHVFVRRLQSSRGTTRIVSLQHRRCCLLKSPNIYQLEFSSQIQ